jgi:uncharacterized membrane protein
MLKFILAYVATAVAFMIMDFGWLSLTAARLYRPILGPLMADQLDVGAAVAFYAIYLGGLVVFAVRPALKSRRWEVATLFGVLLGLVAYSTYDLTNQATLRLWSIKITLADLAWGMTVSAVASTVGYLAAARLNRGGLNSHSGAR